MTSWNNYGSFNSYKCPCTKDCTERSAECHSTCEAYLEYERKRIAESTDRPHAGIYPIKKEQAIARKKRLY